MHCICRFLARSCRANHAEQCRCEFFPQFLPNHEKQLFGSMRRPEMGDARPPCSYRRKSATQSSARQPASPELSALDLIAPSCPSFPGRTRKSRPRLVDGETRPIVSKSSARFDLLDLSRGIRSTPTEIRRSSAPTELRPIRRFSLGSGSSPLKVNGKIMKSRLQKRRFDHSPWIEWNSINSDVPGLFCAWITDRY